MLGITQRIIPDTNSDSKAVIQFITIVVQLDAPVTYKNHSHNYQQIKDKSQPKHGKADSAAVLL
jgi:hypothetical protein